MADFSVGDEIKAWFTVFSKFQKIGCDSTPLCKICLNCFFFMSLYFSVHMFSYFRLTKGHVTLFRPKTIVSSFLNVIMFITEEKVFFSKIFETEIMMG